MKPKLSDIVKYFRKNDKPKPKELPTVFVSDKSSSRIKKYNDSLNLYNTSVEMATNMAKALAKGAYDTDIKYGVSKRDAEKQYKKLSTYYNQELVEPITKRRKPLFGRISNYSKQTEGFINKEEKDYYTRQQMSDDNQSKYVSKEFLKGYVKLGKLNSKIKPVAYASAAELPTIPIYKKPVQPVQYREPEPVKETKKEQPKLIQSKQNVYQGSPVYSSGTGSGLPSALIGFMSKSGDTTYIKPEDYQRFGVPKYGKDFIESKTKKK